MHHQANEKQVFFVMGKQANSWFLSGVCSAQALDAAENVTSCAGRALAAHESRPYFVDPSLDSHAPFWG